MANSCGRHFASRLAVSASRAESCAAREQRVQGVQFSCGHRRATPPPSPSHPPPRPRARGVSACHARMHDDIPAMSELRSSCDFAKITACSSFSSLSSPTWRAGRLPGFATAAGTVSVATAGKVGATCCGARAAVSRSGVRRHAHTAGRRERGPRCRRHVGCHGTPHARRQQQAE